MNSKVIQFYFDYISPYAYLAWTQLPALAHRCDARLEPIPILFAALLNHHGHKGPAEIPSKRIYVGKNIIRLAAGMNVPLAIPPSHPFNPLLALRVSSLDLDNPTRHRIVDSLFKATWGTGQGVTDPVVVEQIAIEAGLDDPLQRAVEPANKERLKQNTARAIELRLFGVPSMVVDGELFWGVDSLPHLEQFLQGCDPVTSDMLAQWSTLKPSATR